MQILNEDWTAEVVGEMHKYRISNVQLADACGLTSPYLSTVLNGKKSFTSEESKQATISKIRNGLHDLIEKIEGQSDAGTIAQAH